MNSMRPAAIIAGMPKRPRDISQLAKLITEITVGDKQDHVPDAGRRKGGVKGGRQRAIALSPAERSEIAKLAAAARWKNK